MRSSVRENTTLEWLAPPLQQRALIVGSGQAAVCLFQREQPGWADSIMNLTEASSIPCVLQSIHCSHLWTFQTKSLGWQPCPWEEAAESWLREHCDPAELVAHDANKLSKSWKESTGQAPRRPGKGKYAQKCAREGPWLPSKGRWEFSYSQGRPFLEKHHEASRRLLSAALCLRCEYWVASKAGP